MQSSESSRALIASHYNATRFVYDSNAFEAVSAFAQMDAADVLAPGRPADEFKRRVDGVARFVRQKAGLTAGGRIDGVEIDRPYDLFVYVASVLTDVPEIRRLKTWRKRAGKAACVLLKTWTSEIEKHPGIVRMLDEFDIVYTATLQSLDLLQSRLSTPVRFLTLAVPTLDLAPSPGQARPIDTYGMGRRPPQLQTQMMQAMKEGRFNYYYDTFDVRLPIVKDFESHCLLKASLLKQTKFLPSFGIQSFQSLEQSLAGSEDTIPLRCFEGAAAGAVLFGTLPTSPDFLEQFDWEDIIVPVPSMSCDFIDFLRSIETDAPRIERIRARNVANCLRRHDFAYRYERILSDLGLAPHPKLVERKATLQQMADALDSNQASGGRNQKLALSLGR